MHTIKKQHLNEEQYLTTSALQGKYILMKLTSQSKPLFASFNPWFSFTPVWKIKIKHNSSIVFFFINILKFTDERTFTRCIYTVTVSVCSTIQMNKDNLTIHNDKMSVCTCYQDKAAIGRSLYLILNFSSTLRSIRSPCV